MTPRVEIVDAGTTRALRMQVLRPNAAPDTADPAPGDGPGAIHFAALDDAGTVIGTAALLPESMPRNSPYRGMAFQVRGMAVDPELRGGGVGSAVLRGCFAEATARGGRLMWCNARVTAVPFYARHGMHAAGEEFVAPDSGLLHVEMWTELPVDPTSSVG